MRKGTIDFSFNSLPIDETKRKSVGEKPLNRRKLFSLAQVKSQEISDDVPDPLDLIKQKSDQYMITSESLQKKIERDEKAVDKYEQSSSSSSQSLQESVSNLSPSPRRENEDEEEKEQDRSQDSPLPRDFNFSLQQDAENALILPTMKKGGSVDLLVGSNFNKLSKQQTVRVGQSLKISPSTEKLKSLSKQSNHTSSKNQQSGSNNNNTNHNNPDVIQEESFESSNLSKSEDKNNKDSSQSESIDYINDKNQQFRPSKITIISSQFALEAAKPKSLEDRFQKKNLIEEQIDKEIKVVTYLVNMMKKDLDRLINYIKGHRFQWLDHQLTNLYNSLLTNQVPRTWLSYGFPCKLSINLKDWLDQLVIKITYVSSLKKNQNNEQSNYIDMQRLFKPKYILNQLYFRYLFEQNCIAGNYNNDFLTQIEIQAQLLDRKVTSVEIQKYLIKIKHNTEKNICTVVQHVYITGIKLVNARIDLITGYLEDSKRRQYEQIMPAMCLTISKSIEKEQSPTKKSLNLAMLNEKVQDNHEFIPIRIHCNQVPVIAANKGFYRFRDLEDMKQMAEKGDLIPKTTSNKVKEIISNANQGLNLKKRSMSLLQSKQQSTPEQVPMPKRMLSREHSNDFAQVLRVPSPSIQRRPTKKPDSQKNLNVFQVSELEEVNLVKTMREKQFAYNSSTQFTKNLSTTALLGKNSHEEANPNYNYNNQTFSDLSQQRYNHTIDQNEVIHGNQEQLENMLPFARRSKKIFEVKIPFLVDFMINVKDHDQDNLKYHFIFQSHFNQAYWDSVGAYAVCEFKQY